MQGLKVCLRVAQWYVLRGRRSIEMWMKIRDPVFVLFLYYQSKQRYRIGQHELAPFIERLISIHRPFSAIFGVSNASGDFWIRPVDQNSRMLSNCIKWKMLRCLEKETENFYCIETAAWLVVRRLERHIDLTPIGTVYKSPVKSSHCNLYFNEEMRSSKPIGPSVSQTIQEIELTGSLNFRVFQSPSWKDAHSTSMAANSQHAEPTRGTQVFSFNCFN